MNFVWGTITGYGTKNPTIHSGSNNFQVSRVAKGQYLIDFQDPFQQPPALTLTQQFTYNPASPLWTNFPNGGGDTRDNTTIIALDNEQAKIKTGDNNGNAQDRNFSFIAIGN